MEEKTAEKKRQLKLVIDEIENPKVVDFLFYFVSDFVASNDKSA